MEKGESMKKAAAILFALAALVAIGVATGGAGAGTRHKAPAGPAIVHKHVTAIFADGSTRSLDVDSGRITSLSETALTITRADKVVLSFNVTSETKVFPGSRAALKLGDPVQVTSEAGKTLAIFRGIRGVGHGKGPQVGYSKSARPKLAASSRYEGNENAGRGNGKAGGKKSESANGRRDRADSLANVVHAEIEVVFADGTTKSWNWDRGMISAISSTSLTLKRADGQSVTLVITDATKLLGKGKKGSIADLELGDAVAVRSESGGNATVVCAKLRAPKHGSAEPPAIPVADLRL